MPALLLTAIFTVAVVVGSRVAVPLGLSRAAISVFLFTAATIALALTSAAAIARLRRVHRHLHTAARIHSAGSSAS